MKGREGYCGEGYCGEGKGRKGKGIVGKGREGKAREGKGREGYCGKGKGREGKLFELPLLRENDEVLLLDVRNDQVFTFTRYSSPLLQIILQSDVSHCVVFCCIVLCCFALHCVVLNFILMMMVCVTLFHAGGKRFSACSAAVSHGPDS